MCRVSCTKVAEQRQENAIHSERNSLSKGGEGVGHGRVSSFCSCMCAEHKCWQFHDFIFAAFDHM